MAVTFSSGRRTWRALLILLLIPCAALAADNGRWSEARAAQWYAAQPWPVGVNFVPRYASNPLEMWQADTFDLKIIDQELGWAQGIGINAMRVFLHNLLWQENPQAFLQRIDEFLAVADKHHIRIMLVLFDDCWDPQPLLGKQKEPRPHVHNSRWVQAPGAAILGDPAKQDTLESYVKGVIGRFARDPRVLLWDLYNEPGNPNKGSYGSTELADKPTYTLQLLQKTFRWARAVNPTQPLTAGLWVSNPDDTWVSSPLYDFMRDNSDVISFHGYVEPQRFEKALDQLRPLNRPLICTEYMARPFSTIAGTLPILARERAGAFSWGFVDGRSQTVYPWDSWDKVHYTAEPALWFHDLLRADGTPFNASETAVIKALAEAMRRPR